MWHYFITALFATLTAAIVWGIILFAIRAVQSQARRIVLKGVVEDVVLYDLQHFNNTKPLHEFFPEDFKLSYLKRRELRQFEELYDRVFQQQFEKLEQLTMQNTLLHSLQQNQRKPLPAPITLQNTEHEETS